MARQHPDDRHRRLKTPHTGSGGCMARFVLTVAHIVVIAAKLSRLGR